MENTNAMELNSADVSMHFKRDDDAYCTHAVLGKYLGNLALNFKSGKKKVMVFHRSNNDIVIIDKPVKGLECVMGDSLENIIENEQNKNAFAKFLGKFDLTIDGNKAVFSTND